MKNIMIVLVTCAFCIIQTNKLIAQVEKKATDSYAPRKDFKHAVNVCPIAVFLGVYAVNYEYLFVPSHGLDARFEYQSIPKTYTDASIESNGISFSLNYRWHISKEMNSLFLGSYVRYSLYNGTGAVAETKFDFTINDFTWGLNVGKRWAWNSGLNVTIAAGYGIATNSSQSHPTDPSIEAAIDQYKNDYDFLSPVYGEVSMGYAFHKLSKQK